MATKRKAREAAEHDAASLRQVLHWATGDRDAEAKVLADRDPTVTVRDAKTAVGRAHGDVEPKSDHDVATTDDAEAVHREHEPGPGSGGP